ncbi:MAG: FAD-binding oxidoreductase [Melioribacteraceae bacterium]|nr:FAD-binding oxidoreductase [Melioribacteraceae bacterium]
MPENNFENFLASVKKFVPDNRLITDRLRLLAFGTDASLYRLIPKLVIKVENETEVVRIIKSARKLDIPLTFRAAGTSLSGQSVTDSVLVMLGTGWKELKISDDLSSISLQPGVIGSRANLELRPYNLKIGPDPASINSAMIGGIAANNASGMCCGTAQNSYNTLKSMRIIFSDGTLLDTASTESVSEFKANNGKLIEDILNLSASLKSNKILSDRIRSKYKMKNTTGYSINSLVDFEDPIDIIQHLMIGSEGTLGFISEVTYYTVADEPYKASALILFKSIKDACSAIPPLKKCPVDAVEIMDRAALRSVENKPGMPGFLSSLSATATALLIETSANNETELKSNIKIVLESIDNFEFEMPPEFTSVKWEYEQLWKIRKGLFPSVGAMRKAGTTVIIEDVCFSVDKLADAALDLQSLFKKYHYNEAIIFGHSLEGNLHFVFGQDFNTESEVKRYNSFMNEVVNLVVDKYDGALKAEHGTGRNMAPFVVKEWGEEAYELMKKIKSFFDPQNILNPGVVLNEDPQIHIKNLKPMPVANEIIDKCIECGFCEVNCPSKDLTITPRQRIVVWREIQRLRSISGSFDELNELVKDFNYYGNQTCATDGLCALSCPVEIDTGKLIKELRAEAVSPTADSIAEVLSENMNSATSAIRNFLNAVNFTVKLLGERIICTASGILTKVSFNKVPKYNKLIPRGAGTKYLSVISPESNSKVVYFPSCITRTMGTASDYETTKSVPEVTVNLLHKAGYQIIYPDNVNNLCCGMAFDSKGYKKQGKKKAEELLSALQAASDNWKYPVLFDMSPCLYRIKEFINSQNSTYKGAQIFEQVEFIHDYLLERLKISKSNRTISLHVTCSSTKMGLENKFKTVAEACAENVIIPKDVGCCGFAGDRGFTYPELNKSALRNLKDQLPENCREGYSNSRTCEIGLSEHSGINYKSIVYLVDEVSD